ncbi:MAG: CU044_5270 family protein [Streptosporangiaceae bacterium]
MNIEELIHSANPLETAQAPQGDSPMARHILAGLPARRDPRRTARLTLGGLTAGGLAAAIAVTALPAQHPAPDAASGPGAAILRKLILTASRQPAMPGLQPGQFQYTQSVSLTESTYASASSPGHARALPDYSVDYAEQRQFWIASDGSGRLVETMINPIFPTARDRAHWVANGRPSLVQQPLDQTFGPHGLSSVDVSTLPTDPAQLARLISSRAIEGGPRGPGEDFIQVGDLLRETDASPALRAALFQVASHIPGVTVISMARDHSGRSGIALKYVASGSASGSPFAAGAEQEYIFNPATSAMIAEMSEGVSAGAAPGLNWTDYLRSFVVSSTTSTTPATTPGDAQ